MNMKYARIERKPIYDIDSYDNSSYVSHYIDEFITFSSEQEMRKHAEQHPSAKIISYQDVKITIHVAVDT